MAPPPVGQQLAGKLDPKAAVASFDQQLVENAQVDAMDLKGRQRAFRRGVAPHGLARARPVEPLREIRHSGLAGRRAQSLQYGASEGLSVVRRWNGRSPTVAGRRPPPTLLGTNRARDRLHLGADELDIIERD